MPTVKEQRLSGWGRYPVEPALVFRPEKRTDVSALLKQRLVPNLIPRGLGRSYGDCSLNPGGGVILNERLNRLIDFDEREGLVTCESGVSLAELVDVFLPRGWFPPVTPGTKFVTVGGAIANDVHGKNHHRDGTFSQFVLKLTLMTPTGEVLVCSRTENSDVFWATTGGVGLTGYVLDATIKMHRVTSGYVRVDSRRTSNIDDLLAAIDESDQKYQYSVAWVDCLARGKSLGRSVLMSGDHFPASDLDRARKDRPFDIPRKFSPGVPFDFPGFALNALSVHAFNSAYYATHPTRPAQIIDYDSYFYPLDKIHHWNRIYGKQGFTQYQATFPLKAAKALAGLIEMLSRSGRASFLAVLKRFGPAGPGLLSYPSEGYTLTLDIPIRAGAIDFLGQCDRFVLEHGGRLYLAKDVSTTPEVFAEMYPRLDEFRQIQAKLDPKRIMSSRIARRVGILAP